MNDAKILLVDDEEELRRSTAQALELSGFSVETFSNGDHVLELIGYSFPGVVVSDIRMPGMDGMTLMQKIREIDPEVPVILVTGHGDVQLAVRAMRE
ncbi:response regulator, partial [Rhizobium ruizarguesonis]